MPYGDISNCKISFKANGEFEWIKPVHLSDVTLEPELIEPCPMEKTYHKSKSFSFSFKAKNSDFNRMVRTAAYGTNNWRKMHGLPMIRKWMRKI